MELEKEKERLEEQLGFLQQTVNMDKDTFAKEVSILRERASDLSAELQDSKATSTTLTSNNEKLQQEKDSLTEILGSLQATLQTTNMEKGAIEKEIASLRERTKVLSTDLESTLATNINLASNIDGLKQEKQSLQEKLVSKDEEFLEFQNEVRVAAEQAKRKTIVLSLHIGQSGMGKAMVEMVTRELSSGLKGRVNKVNMDVLIQSYQESSDENEVILVPYLDMSMTRIQDALKGIKVSKSVILLVLHNTRKEHLSSITPTAFRSIGGELRQIGGIIDMAFSTGADGGLFECSFNTRAIENLATFIQELR